MEGGARRSVEEVLAAAERSLAARQTAAAPLLQHGHFFLFPPGGEASAAPVSGRSRALLSGMLSCHHPHVNLAELAKRGRRKKERTAGGGRHADTDTDTYW